MPTLHLNVVVKLDEQTWTTFTRHASLTEFAMIDRHSLSASAQDDGLCGATPSAAVLRFPGGGTFSFAGFIVNGVTLDADGAVALTNTLDYTVQVGAVGRQVQGIG